MENISKEDKARFEFASEYYARMAKGDIPAWQCRLLGSSDSWSVARETGHKPYFYPEYEYRFAQKTITINDVEVVAPRLPKSGSNAIVHFWSGLGTIVSTVESEIFSEQLVFDSVEDARTFREAMLKAIGE